jgi:hypothetical protein
VADVAIMASISIGGAMEVSGGYNNGNGKLQKSLASVHVS